MPNLQTPRPFSGPRSEATSERTWSWWRVTGLSCTPTAIEHSDIDTLLSMLTDDATWAMPPLPTWYQGKEALSAFLTKFVVVERWRHVSSFASGQLAIGGYLLDSARRRYVASALDVITIEEGRVAGVVGFLRSEIHGVDEFGLVDFRKFGFPPELPS